MQYELHVYGDPKYVEEFKEQYNNLVDPVNEVKLMRSGEGRGWQFKDGKLELVDPNPNADGKAAVIHTIEPISE